MTEATAMYQQYCLCITVVYQSSVAHLCKCYGMNLIYWMQIVLYSCVMKETLRKY